MTDILYFTPDIMFSSRVLQEAAALGRRVELVPQFSALLERLAASSPRLILLDLGAGKVEWPALAQQLALLNPRPRVIAYGPHVQEDTLAAAQAAGCDQVLTRGQFHREMGAMLERGLKSEE